MSESSPPTRSRLHMQSWLFLFMQKCTHRLLIRKRLWPFTVKASYCHGNVLGLLSFIILPYKTSAYSVAVFLFKFRLDFYFIISKIPVLSKALQSRSRDIFLTNPFCFIVHTAVKANYTVISSSAYPFYLCSSTSQNIFGIFTFSADGSNKHNGIIFLLRKRKNVNSRTNAQIPITAKTTRKTADTTFM